MAGLNSWVNLLEWTACVVCFSWGCSDSTPWKPLWWVSILALFAFPILNEILLCLKGVMFRASVRSADYSERFNLKDVVPIVYSTGYNITACGIERCHPFDSTKYLRVYSDLNDTGTLSPSRSRLHDPELPSREFLQFVMSPWYLFLLNYSLKITMCVELPLFFLPEWFLRMRVLEPMMRAARGSVDAAYIARHHGWAINLSGGYHHAHRASGGGFCIYPDITFVTTYMEEWFGLKRFLIIDLDAHQGNGHERDHMDKEKYYIVDAYNHGIYPGDTEAKKAISADIPVRHRTSDDQYLRSLEQPLAKAFEQFRPDFVIYNAGTDCLEGDPLGNLSITKDGIIRRDELVFKFAYEIHKVPIVMVLSGGYQMSNAPIIADSIRNLVQTFDLLKSN